jgi:hypothetical protein
MQEGGTKTVAELKIGDNIKSLNSLEQTDSTFSKVIDATIIEGSFTAHTLLFSNGSSLTVTSPHYMIVYKDENAKVVPASDVQVGDYMRMRDGNLSSVVRVDDIQIDRKVSVNTESGLMYVNGVLATGMCEYGPKEDSSAEKFLLDYKEVHREYEPINQNKSLIKNI